MRIACQSPLNPHIVSYITIVLFGLVIATFSAFSIISEGEADNYQRTKRLASTVSLGLERSFDDVFNVLSVLENQMSAYPDIITFDQFQTTLNVFLRDQQRREYSRAIAWIPQITAANAEHYYQLGRESYASVPGVDFSFMNKTDEGTLIEIEPQQVKVPMYPVLYVGPNYQQSVIIGFNMMNNSLRRDAIIKANQTHSLYIINAPSLIDGLPSIVVFKAIKNNRNQSSGFIYASFNTASYIANVMDEFLSVFPLSMIICDRSTRNSSSELLYFSAWLNNNTFLSSAKDSISHDPRLGAFSPLRECWQRCEDIPGCVEVGLTVANRQWSIMMVRTLEPDYITTLSLFMLILIVTFTLIFVIWNTAKKLRMAEVMLQKEILARERATEAIVQAEKVVESKLFFLTNMSHELKTPLVIRFCIPTVHMITHPHSL
jgi:glycerol uptake facilitator-like aquaporin